MWQYLFKEFRKRYKRNRKEYEIAHYLRYIKYRPARVNYCKSFPKVFEKARQQARIYKRAQYSESRRQHDGAYRSAHGQQDRVFKTYSAKQKKDGSDCSPMNQVGDYPSIYSPYESFQTYEDIGSRYARQTEHVSVYCAEQRDYFHVGNGSKS